MTNQDRAQNARATRQSKSGKTSTEIQNDYRMEVINLCERFNQELIKINEPVLTRTKHIVKCSCSNEYQCSLYDLRRKKSVGCKQCNSTILANQYRDQNPGKTASDSIIDIRKLSRSERRRLRIRTNSCDTISNKNEMISFLENNPHRYNDYILSLYTKPDASHVKNRPGYQAHHIFPLHSGGPDISWNILSLSPYEHAMAHVLLAMDSVNKNDMVTVNILNLSLEGLKKFSNEELEVAVREAVDKGNKEVREKIGPVKANSVLLSDSTWVHTDLKDPVFIPAGTVLQLGDLQDLFKNKLQYSVSKQRLSESERKNFRTRLALHFSGQQASVFGWRLVALKDINLNKLSEPFIQKTMVWNHYSWMTPSNPLNNALVIKAGTLTNLLELRDIFLSKYSGNTKTVHQLSSFSDLDFFLQLLFVFKGLNKGVYGIHLIDFY